MIKVSVIVPVYNGEEYLQECLDTITNQTLNEIEIICIDDGSTDTSIKILKEYKDSDKRIQIYEQEHKYAGSARNLGMSHAKGEYLAFWDCDDFFDLEALEKMYKIAKKTNADVIVCGANQYFNNKNHSYPSDSYANIKLCPNTETFNRFSNPKYYLNFTNSAAWNKLFKRNYIEKIDLKFQNIRNGNDIYFTANAIGLADRIAVTDEKLITYRRNKDSGLVSTLSKSPLSSIQAWMDTAKNLEKYEGFGEQSFANRAIDAMLYLLYNLQDWEAFLQAVKTLKTYGLNALHIYPIKEYYYSTWREECAMRLYNDTPEQFALFLMHHFYLQRDEFSAEYRFLKGQQKNLNITDQKLKKENQTLKEQGNTLKKEIRMLKKENEKLENDNNNLLNSTTFRIGSKITWLPRKIKNLLKDVRAKQN